MDSDRRLHVAFFPWLAFGHMLPNLELAKNIGRLGHKVTFISTTRNIDRLLGSSPPQTSSIEFLKLSLPHVPNLPPNAEATSDVKFHEHYLLKKASDDLEGEISAFLHGSRPDWIIHDFNSYWLPSAAKRAGVSSAFFIIIPCWTICYLGSSAEALTSGNERNNFEEFVSPPTWIPFPSSLCCKPYEAKKIFQAIEDDSSGITDGRRSGMVISGCNLVIPRSSNEVEGEWIKLLGHLHKKPVAPAGTLPPPSKPTLNGGAPEAIAWGKIRGWLDKWEKGTVAYIALGSEAQLTQELLNEMALGIEISGLPFLWAFKVPDSSIRLPEGYVERTADRGLVCTEWVPQVNVLAHDTVGGFLTHCGWGSIVEGLTYGRPLVMLPMFLDQGLNARILQERGVGVEIERDADDGSFVKESVAEALLTVMSKKRKIFVENAKKMKYDFGDEERNDKYVEGLVEILTSMRAVS